jgi:tRNA uridine 5-carboxymethylaminomethyl modification enzyme
LRLTETGRRLGLVDDARWRAFCQKREAIERERMRLARTFVSTSSSEKVRAIEYLRRPEVRYAELADPAVPVAADVAEQLEVQVKYEGYVERQRAEVARRESLEEMPIPETFDYAAVRGLSVEVRQKLSVQRPQTLGQAGRISGVTPAAISLLAVHLKRNAGARKDDKPSVRTA